MPLSWSEQVSRFSIHGEAASPRDVERLASEYIDANARIDALLAHGERLEKRIEELQAQLAAAVTGPPIDWDGPAMKREPAE